MSGSLSLPEIQSLESELSGDEQVTKSDFISLMASEVALAQVFESSTMYSSLSAYSAHVSAQSGFELAEARLHVDIDDWTMALQMVLVR